MKTGIENESHAVAINYYLKQPDEEEVKITVCDGSRIINEFHGSNHPGLNRVEWG